MIEERYLSLNRFQPKKPSTVASIPNNPPEGFTAQISPFGLQNLAETV